MKVIIIGGVAGGASTACRLRRLDEHADIVMYERGAFVSFANCGLPYHIGGVIEDRKKLLVQTPEKLHQRFNIDVRVKHEVTSVDPGTKTVTVKNLDTGDVFEDSYDKLVLSPGARAIKPPIEGIENKKIHTLSTIPDMDEIMEEIKNGAKKAIVVGGGYIGVEAAENLRERGLHVILLEMMDQILTFLDPELGSLAIEDLWAHDVDVWLGNAVTGFKAEDNQGITALLSDGTSVTADFVVLAIGVKPEITLARNAGLQIGSCGGIMVDENMQTSDPNIYAVGDAVEVEHFVTKQNTLIPLAGPANRQGRIVANNIAGIPSVYTGTQGTSIIKVFDLVCAATGASSAQLERANMPFQSAMVHTGAHAGYYPDPYVIHLKLLYDPESGKVLGAQAVGYEGVDKRIDVIATAIRQGATMYDLEDLELAYAPPFGSAKDPVNMAGFVAVNQLSGISPAITIFELDTYLDEGAVLLDVRTKTEVSRGIIRGAYHIPVDSLRKRLNELPGDKTIIVYCKVGLRGYIAQRILMENGFKALNISGGYDTFTHFYRQKKEAGVEIEDKIADDTQTHLNG